MSYNRVIGGSKYIKNKILHYYNFVLSFKIKIVRFNKKYVGT